MIDRIKQLLEWQRLSPTQFADRIGVGRPVVSHILSERNKPSLDVVQRIITAFPELSLPWLLSGSGAMLATLPPTAATGVPTSTKAAATAFPVLADTLPERTAAAVPTTPEPARHPVANTEASMESQPTSYPRVTPGTVGPTRFRAGGASPAIATELGAARFVAAPARPQLAELAAAQPAVPGGAVVAPLLPPLPSTTGVSVPGTTVIDEPSAATPVSPAVAPSAPPTKPEAAVLAQAMSKSLGDPGKTIRRIVLFYTDGSFADFKPE